VAPTSKPPQPIVVVVSANAEWKAIALPDKRIADTPHGEWFAHRFGDREVIFFHGGFGKVAAAASTQYLIERWRPRLIVNLGTCGGFGGERKVGDVVLVDRTVIYDIVEQMSDPDETIRDYASDLDITRWPAHLRDKVVVGPIVSGDRDLIPADLPMLANKYKASVGDWESGAIAWTARKNKTPVLILRAVTDVVDAKGSPTYGNHEHWVKQTKIEMAALIELFAAALTAL
jgi:adenosylhomocysteine nucleosidase